MSLCAGPTLPLSARAGTEEHVAVALMSYFADHAAASVERGTPAEKSGSRLASEHLRVALISLRRCVSSHRVTIISFRISTSRSYARHFLPPATASLLCLPAHILQLNFTSGVLLSLSEPNPA